MNPALSLIVLRKRVADLDVEYDALRARVDESDPEQLRNLKELEAVREEAHAILRSVKPKKPRKRRKKR